MPDYRNEIVAESKALALLGYSTRKTAAELAKLFPGEPTPSHTAVADWRAADDSLQEELAQNELSISYRADELVVEKMKAIGDDLKTVRLPELVMTAGVYRDKTFRRMDIKEKQKQTEAGQALADAINRLAQLSVPELHDVIEGEAKEIE